MTGEHNTVVLWKRKDIFQKRKKKKCNEKAGIVLAFRISLMSGFTEDSLILISASALSLLQDPTP